MDCRIANPKERFITGPVPLICDTFQMVHYPVAQEAYCHGTDLQIRVLESEIWPIRKGLSRRVNACHALGNREICNKPSSAVPTLADLELLELRAKNRRRAISRDHPLQDTPLEFRKLFVHVCLTT